MAETLMRPVGDRLIPFDDARKILFEALAPTLRSENVPLLAAHGRVTASEIRAPIDVPAFDRSAMDGYALRSADSSNASATKPTGFRLVGAAHAGTPYTEKIRAGDCVQIATGAPIPPGTDAVVMVERTRRVADQVWVEKPLRGGENVTRQGADVQKRSVAVPHNAVLSPARLGLLASLGVTSANVFVPPRVALLSTGSELKEPGSALELGQIYDSNSIALAALLEQHGAKVDRSGILPDDPKALRNAIQRFRGYDLVLVTGSSSAGERDYLAETVRNLGSIVYHGVAVKPGKPLLLAKVQAKPILGLAGNPASCLLMTYTLVVPALRRFQHLPLDWERKVRAKLAHRIPSPPGRRHFVPVRLKEGGFCESVYKESDATTSVSEADGYIEVPDAAEWLDEGTVVIVRLF